MKIHTLVIDCDGRQRNNSHFTIEESVATAKLLRAQKVGHSSITFPQQICWILDTLHQIPDTAIRFIAWACRALWASMMTFAKNLRGKKIWT
jgi:hypothetical protein